MASKLLSPSPNLITSKAASRTNKHKDCDFSQISAQCLSLRSECVIWFCTRTKFGRYFAVKLTTDSYSFWMKIFDNLGTSSDTHNKFVQAGEFFHTPSMELIRQSCIHIAFLIWHLETKGRPGTFTWKRASICSKTWSKSWYESGSCGLNICSDLPWKVHPTRKALLIKTSNSQELAPIGEGLSLF